VTFLPPPPLGEVKAPLVERRHPPPPHSSVLFFDFLMFFDVNLRFTHANTPKPLSIPPLPQIQIPINMPVSNWPKTIKHCILFYIQNYVARSRPRSKAMLLLLLAGVVLLMLLALSMFCCYKHQNDNTTLSNDLFQRQQQTHQEPVNNLCESQVLTTTK